MEEIDDLPGDLAQEIRHFFEVYTDLEGKEWRVEGWESRERALEVCREARERYEQNER